VKRKAQFNDHLIIIIEAIGLFISTSASALAFAQVPYSMDNFLFIDLV